jgi:hypothetical protein
MVMVMPPFFGATMTVAEADVRAWFGTLASAIDIPILIQDTPLSSTPLSVNSWPSWHERSGLSGTPRLRFPKLPPKYPGSPVSLVISSPVYTTTKRV